VALVSHAVVGATQSPLTMHPPVGLQLPTAPLTSLQVWPTGQPLRMGAALQPGTQIPTGPLQIKPDVGPPQSPSPATSLQPQMPTLATQRGLAPTQRALLVGEHSVQAPARGPVVWQTGRAGSAQLGAPLTVQGMHWCVAGEQNGVGPAQSLFDTQPTQIPPLTTSHTGRAAGQAARLVAEHSPQAPLGKQAGVVPPHSPSPPHPRQTLVPPSQTGLSPGQVAALTQPTQ
jgi:hypothetical protein